MECVSNRRFAKQQFFERECLNWVKSGKARNEHNMSGLPPCVAGYNSGVVSSLATPDFHQTVSSNAQY